MDNATLKTIRSQAQRLSVTLQIGKSGVTQTLIAELTRQLKLRTLVKIKFLAGAFPEPPSKKERQALAALLAEKTGAEIIYQIGFIVTLYKK